MTFENTTMNEMMSVAQAAQRIKAGAVMAIAGPAAALEQLPNGRWIGGTTIFAPSDPRGKTLFCTTFPQASDATTIFRDVADFPNISDGYHVNGVTLMMVPAFSFAHAEFLAEGAHYPHLFDQPLGLWVTGVARDDLGLSAPMMFDGATGRGYDEGAVMLHIGGGAGGVLALDMLNILAPADLPEVAISFAADGFTATTAQVNGEEVNLAQYLTAQGIDPQRPLVTQSATEIVTIGMQSIDDAAGVVWLRAPVTAGAIYSLARAPGIYSRAFEFNVGADEDAPMTTNVTVNSLYGGLDAYHAQNCTTFGDSAHLLLSKTLARRRTVWVA